MAESLDSSSGLIDLTIILFFVFYAVGTLFWGPLSDKYGRKRILMVGLVIYTAATLFH
ncbi:MFS transporter [Petroclostridium sp. X23]|uniref:MFS transporter n=1 Tax=Petroclostridium sp. X23 TaxID=3045146 RepID=UPI0032C0F6C8